MPKTFKFFKWSGKKAVVFCVLTVVLALAVVGTTLAIIIDRTDPLVNTFPPANVNINMVGNTVTNHSDTSVYVRAAVVVTWVNNNGTPDDATDDTTLSTAPVEGTDYNITFNTSENWAKGADGFWYQKNAVAAGGSAPALIGSVTQETTVEGYTLTVQVLTSAIQAIPATAVVESWSSGVSGVDTNGALILK